MLSVEPAHVSTKFIERISKEFARRHLIIGLGDSEHVSSLLFASQTDPISTHNVQARLGPVAEHATGDAESIARLIDAAYAGPTGSSAAGQPGGAGRADRADREDIPSTQLSDAESTDVDLDAEFRRLVELGEQDLLNVDGKGPVVRLVDAVLLDAIGKGASDIHLQPLADVTLVRYRLDGVLLTVRRVPPRIAPAVVSRIKVMARLDVAERRAPQDGRATVTIGRGQAGRAIDLRIATLPSAYGERMVLRLLDTQRGGSLATLDALGMPADLAERYTDRAGRSSGIVLVTGPTGSGKTTTLYATLRWIASRSALGRNASDVNVLTIEDPIEYDLATLGPAGGDGRAPQGGLPISQTQVDAKKGMTFATGLRHILRQDPDVIMVGEIRDADTARIAIQASLTGHLVFSTLHTADAPGAITRLLDLGVEPYLAASSLSCVLAQRLVRLLHRRGAGNAGCDGQGCAECLHSGFKGRRGVFELLTVGSEIREMITSNATAAAIRDAAVARGMERLEQQGMRMVESGLTTAAEVRRVTLGAD